jgi:hypothetical protein
VQYGKLVEGTPSDVQARGVHPLHDYDPKKSSGLYNIQEMRPQVTTPHADFQYAARPYRGVLPSRFHLLPKSIDIQTPHDDILLLHLVPSTIDNPCIPLPKMLQ